MNFTQKEFLIFALAFFFIFAAMGSTMAAEIDVDLEEKMAQVEEDEMIRVLIRLDEDPLLLGSMGNEEAVEMMKNSASQSQEKFLNKLESSNRKMEIVNQFWLVNVVSAEVEKSLVKDIAEMDEVRKLYSTFELKVPEPEKEVTANQDWEHVETTKAPEFWDEGFQGQGITVAVLDTGIDADHPEFDGELSYWAEFDENGEIISEDPDDAYDSGDHGSHTSGTVYARNVGEYNIGMAPEATMAHGLVLPGGGGEFEQVAAGMEWAADNGFDVVNMSLGGAGQNDLMREASDNLWDSGVFLAASIGNDGAGNTGAPGNTPRAIGVGAYGSDGEITSFSGGGIVEYPDFDYDENSRIKPDISGPGDEIYSVNPGGGYQNMSGTSMSSPHLAGAAALIKSANPDMDVEELRDILYNSVGDHDDLGWSDESEEKDDRYGWGRINVLKALDEINFVKGPEADINGTVADTDSEDLLEKVEIVFEGPMTKVVETDENGEFETSIPEGYYDITINKMGYEEENEEEVQYIGDKEHDEEFTLTALPEGTMDGVITDSTTGENLKEVEAEFTSPIEEEIEVTDGQFEESLMEEYYSLSFTKEGYYSEVVENAKVAPGQTTEVVVEMVYGNENVTITVSDTEGEVIEDAEIYVEEDEESYYTDEDGEAVLSLTEGEYTLEISKTGYLDVEKDLTVENGKIIEEKAELEENAGTVEGNITNENDEPIEGAEVTVADQSLSATTDEEGNYTLENVEAGEEILVVSHDAYWEQQATVEVENEENISQDFSLEEIDTEVLFEEDFSEDNFDEVWEVTDEDVTWHRTDRKSLYGDHSAWHGDPDKGEYPEGQSVEMTTADFIEIPEDGTVEFSTYIWPDNETSYDYFEIFIEDEEGNKDYIYEHDGAEKEWLEIVGKLSSDYAGEDIKLGFAFTSDTILCYEGTYVDGISLTHIEDETKATVSGEVTDEDGEPVEEATVTVVEDTEENKIKKTSQEKTDEEGKYEMDVPAGKWTVEVDKTPDYYPEEKGTEYVEPGEEEDLDFELEENNPPSSVENLDIVAEGDGFVELAWDAAEEEDLDHYVIYRSLTKDDDDFHKITTTEETEFKIEGLQNDHSYYFKVAAVDEYGQESDLTDYVEGVPVNETPAISEFNVSPKSVYRGASVEVEAELEDPVEGLLDVVLKAEVNDENVREWEFEEIEPGEFTAQVKTKDEDGAPLDATFHDFILEATNEEDKTGVSDDERVLLMSPLPESLSFLVDNNPFDPTEESQKMDYTVPAEGEIEVAIYTMDNELIKTIDEGTKEAGRHSTYWDGRNEKGEMVLNGAYVIKVEYTDNNGDTTVLNKHSVVMK